MTMREPTQRFWDAMIIREWYRFGTCSDLKRICIAEFGCYPDQLPLHRIENCYGGVRAWVATCMPSLSHELLTTPKDRSIEVLNWLGKTKVRCEHNKSAEKHNREARNAFKKANLAAEQHRISYNLEKLLNPMNQPNIVKSTSLKKRIGKPL
jgi:hypothetical protein